MLTRQSAVHATQPASQIQAVRRIPLERGRRQFGPLAKPCHYLTIFPVGGTPVSGVQWRFPWEKTPIEVMAPATPTGKWSWEQLCPVH